MTKNKRASDIERLIQCVICAKNPERCNATEKDEDDRGMCKLWEERKDFKYDKE